MKIGLSIETTRVLRDTWHATVNHEWYDFLQGHTIVPLIPYTKSWPVNDLDLVILCGGNDMPDIVTWRNNNDPVRDAYERNLINSCLQANIPHMGICRGNHFINWIMGGTHRLMSHPYDNIQVQLPMFKVTCHHTIQIDRLAPGFDILAQDSTGVIELAVNKVMRQLLVGWHPERVVNAHTRPAILDLIKEL
jgi:gamma-glutamyl-gamma-aminobutyrate hydrolase PuuD